MSSWDAISNYMGERQDNRDMGQNDHVRIGPQGFVYTDRQPLTLSEDQPDEFGSPGIITGGGGLDEQIDTRPSLTQGPEETWRDTARMETLRFFQEQFGWDIWKARDFAETLWGTSGDLSKTAFGIGVADLLPPISAPLTMQEGIQTFGEGMETGSGTDMALGAVLTAAGALEGIPVIGYGFKMLNKAAQSEVVKEFITVAGDAFNRTGEITQDALIEAGEAAQARLDSMMQGTTLASNPVGAAGDAIVAGAGKIASKLSGSNIRAEGGIVFPVEKTANNLRLHQQRITKMDETGGDYPGGPKNERTVIKAPEGSDLPDVVVGKMTFDDWRTRIEKAMSPDEIEQAAKWYDEVFGEFHKHAQGDPAEVDKLARAWLSGQQNESPANAMGNVLFIYEQIKRGVPASDIKGKGLPSANRVITDILTDQNVEAGVGQKISDFIDSGEGKNVRSIMGNDPNGGQPFVVDVHTGRDTGLVDESYLNMLSNLGYDVPPGLKIDNTGGGVKGTMYESRALFGQQLTQHLNDLGWMGRNDWEPKEVQAIGWMQLTKMYGGSATGGDTASAFARNTRRISMEVDPGEGSAWAQQFGESYNALDDSAKFAINEQVTAKAIEMVNRTEGINLGGIVHGTGGWELYQNPSTVQQAIASRETAIRAGARLGLMLNQTEVWVNSAKTLTKNPKHFGVDIVEEGDSLRQSERLEALFEALIEADPNGLFRGYQPIIAQGETGIRIIIDSDAIKNSPLTKAKASEYIQSFVGEEGALNNVLQKLGLTARVILSEIELTKLRNDWKVDSDGRGYKAHLGDETGASVGSGGRADIDTDRQELTNLFGQLIEEAKPGKSTTSEVSIPPPVRGGE